MNPDKGKIREIKSRKKYSTKQAGYGELIGMLSKILRKKTNKKEYYLYNMQH